jgi:ferredoxin-NADP reductase
MESHIVKIISIEKVTHDVRCFRLERPAGYTFVPGQATEVAINDPRWKDERRPFTFTCLPDAEYLEFTIKTYPERRGVTAQLLQLKPNDELILHDVWGAINYTGKGLFIAGGAGVTPFIAILRHLYQTNQIDGNRLLFANKTKDDIIRKEEFEKILGKNFINILSDEELPGYKHGYITTNVLKEISVHPDDVIYLCGPPLMMDAVQSNLKEMGLGDKPVVMEI